MIEEAATAEATILVVDDNEANRLLAQSTLEDEGYRVLVASGGRAALDIFDREIPDCVLLDAAMPEMDGFAVCTSIRARPQGGDTPVVFLTAHRDVDTFDRALAAGADDFVTKPVRPTELVVRVRAAVKVRRMRTEIDEHYVAIRRQRDALLRVQLQKERLIAFVVHDLKNPVNTMDLHAQALLGEHLSAEAKESVLAIRTEARQLNRMILNLLDLSKQDEGKLQVRRTNVALEAMVAEIFDELRLSADARSVSLRAEIALTNVQVDADLFRRLVANLLENAIRHAPRGTPVRLTAERQPLGFTLDVIDQGSGVPLDKRATIFDAFAQLSKEAPSMTRAGRGLGLTFCKLAAEAHGGTIAVADGAHGGAVFRVWIPDA